MFWTHVLKGVVSTLTVASSPLYRYPYRSAAEALRGDSKRISGDIEGALRHSEGEE